MENLLADKKTGKIKIVYYPAEILRIAAISSCRFLMENIGVLVLLVTSSTIDKKTRKLARNRQNLENRIEIF